jgi:hypothetical protein
VLTGVTITVVLVLASPQQDVNLEVLGAVAACALLAVPVSRAAGKTVRRH